MGIRSIVLRDSQSRRRWALRRRSAVGYDLSGDDARRLRPRVPARAMSARTIRALLLAGLVAGPAFAQGGGLPHTRPADVGLLPARLERITRWLQATVDSGKLPGAVVVVARHGKVAYVASVGAMTTSAVYRVYSLTKPITSAAVMQLVE